MADHADQALSLRLATPADVPAITAIYGHYVRTHTATFEIDPPDEAEMARRMGVIRDAGLPYWVAAFGPEVAGYCYAGRYHARAAYRFTVEDSIYIAPDRVGRGIGRALLAQVLDQCGALGVRQVVAIVGDSANQPSIRLHEAASFRRVGTLQSVGFKFDRWLDTVILQRSLT